MSRRWFLLAMAVVAAGCDGRALPSEETALVIGPPAIVSTTLDAPIADGRYQLIAGRSYTATVNVAAGTISYLVRLEPHDVASSTTITPVLRDDRIDRNTGVRSYSFAVRPSTAGDQQVGFRLRDRGTGNVFQIDAGVAARVRLPAPPRVISTTINAPISADRYRLQAGLPYTVTVAVAAGEATTPIRLDARALDGSLQVAPAFRDGVLAAGSAAHRYTFQVAPTALGDLQVGFHVRHRDSGALLSSDDGVAVSVLSSAPRIVSTTIDGVTPIDGAYRLEVGVRYRVRVRVASGAAVYQARVEPDDAVDTPAWANLHNPSRFFEIAPSRPYHDVPFAITPTRAGAFAIGFMLRDRDWGGPVFDRAGGIDVVVESARTGLYGTITADGRPVAGAQVFLDESTAPVTTGPAGFYHVPSPGPGNHTLRVARDGHSTATGLNIEAPAPGRRFDVALTRAFPLLAERGAEYRHYIDGAHGQTILHAVKLPRSRTEVAIDYHPTQLDVLTKASTFGALVAINGGYFDYTPGNQRPEGYFYRDGRVVAVSPKICIEWPVLGIRGAGTGQSFEIDEKWANFANEDTAPPCGDHPHEWGTSASGAWIWDDDGDAVSDVDQAMASGPTLVDPVHHQVPTSWSPDHLKFWARTALGIAPDGDLWMVVADGEGENGIHGASMPQLGVFFRDVLGAVSAMNLDGGGSTQMLLRTGYGRGDFTDVVRFTSEHFTDEPMTRSDVATFVLAR
jgi:hypothetical protein